MTLPDPPPDLIRQYRRLLAELESAMRLATERTNRDWQCRPGCASCCISFAVLPLEAALLQAAIAGLPPDHRWPALSPAQTGSHCPLLHDDLCRVYAARPVICRTQGLALAYVDEERGAIEVSACPRNFPDGYAFSPENLLFMDPFNSRLFALNLLYCQGQGFAPDKRIPIPEITLRTLGSTP